MKRAERKKPVRCSKKLLVLEKKRPSHRDKTVLLYISTRKDMLGTCTNETIRG